MKNIVGVKFKETGRIYYFNPGGLRFKKDDDVIVETEQGEKFGKIAIQNREIENEKVLKPLKRVLRVATNKDKKRYEECKKIEKEAFKECQKKIKEHKLNMTLTNVECKFDNSKILFYFTSDERVDFRELVRDLASIYKTRIELRQIGVRDEVRRIGGYGVCGRELCCCSYLNNFEAVSIKMAKEQNMSLNPSKISGNCGRLMCCLKYENDVYEEKLKRLPNVGAIVKTEDGEGEVDNVEILKEILRVKMKKDDGYIYKKYNLNDVQIIKDSTKQDNNEEEIENKEELDKLEKLEEEDEKSIQENKNN